jgi:hypothetical protein
MSAPPIPVLSRRARWMRFWGIAIATAVIVKVVGVALFGDQLAGHLVSAAAAGAAVGWFFALRSSVRG